MLYSELAVLEGKELSSYELGPVLSFLPYLSYFLRVKT